MDVYSASRSKGATVQLYSTNHTGAQNFSVTNVQGGVSLRSVLSGRAVTVDSRGALTLGDQTTAGLWQFVGHNDKARLQYVGPGSYKGKVLGVSGQQRSGARLILGGTPIDFAITSTLISELQNQPYVTVAPSGGSSASKVIDCASGGTGDGTNVQLYSSNGTGAQKWQVEYDSSLGMYAFKNVRSQRVLDVNGAGTRSGTNVHLWISNGTMAQRWIVEKEGSAYRIYSGLSGLSLDLSGANFRDGANMQVWAANHTNAQRFLIQGTSVFSNGLYTLYNGSRVADVASGSLTSGANVQLYAPNRTLAQKYYLRRTSGQDVYEVENAADGRLLTDTNGNANKRDRLSGSAASAQRWRLVPTWGGGFVFVNQQTGRALDLSGNRNANGTNIDTYSVNGTGAQRWVPTAANTFDGGVIDIVGNNNMALDVNNASQANGANVQAWSRNYSLAQRWATVNLGGSQWELVNASSARVLEADNGNGNVRQGVWLDYANQKWSFRYLGNGKFALVNAANGKVIVMGGSQGNNAYATYTSSTDRNQQFSIREASLSENVRRNMVVKFASHMGETTRRFNSYYINFVVVNDGGSSIRPNRQGYQCAAWCYFVLKYSGNQYAYGPATAWPGVLYNRFSAASRLSNSPRPGDIALFSWNASWNKPYYRASHAAIVDWANGSGYMLYDGNCGGLFNHHFKSWGQWPLVGFCHPFF